MMTLDEFEKKIIIGVGKNSKVIKSMINRY